MTGSLTTSSSDSVGPVLLWCYVPRKEMVNENKQTNKQKKTPNPSSFLAFFMNLQITLLHQPHHHHRPPLFFLFPFPFSFKSLWALVLHSLFLFFFTSSSSFFYLCSSLDHHSHLLPLSFLPHKHHKQNKTKRK